MSIGTIRTAGDLLVSAPSADYQVGSFKVQLLNIDSAVIIEGISTPFTTALATVMGEIVAIGAGIPFALPIPTPGASALLTALSGGVHTATRLTTE